MKGRYLIIAGLYLGLGLGLGFFLFHSTPKPLTCSNRALGGSPTWQQVGGQTWDVQP